MNQGASVCRITAIINRDFIRNESGIATVKNNGIPVVNYSTGRAVMLNGNPGIFARLLKGRSSTVSSPVEIISFLVNPDLEIPALNLIVEKFKLHFSGNGSVFSEMISVVNNPLDAVVDKLPFPGDTTYHMQTELTGICCIVVRGEGDLVARVALDTGSCVPTIKYGQGAGLRDRLGLWRITIPAEKELVEMVVNSHEAQEIMNIIIDVARIDQPGRGFIYMFPVRQGLINMKVNQTSRSEAASIEQVILAIDELRGGTEWRRRRLSVGQHEQRRGYQTAMTDLTLCCDEGSGAELVKIAMASGASGATITDYKYLSQNDRGARISPARESCSMIVPSKQVPPIITALADAGVLDGNKYESVETRPVSKAFSYNAR